MLRELRDNYRKAKAQIDGKAMSAARLVYNGLHVPGLDIVTGKGPRVARPIAGAFVRMMDGDPMQYFTDGSLRHALGKPDKKQRRLRIKARRLKLRTA
jgi:hypothetical protein